MRKLQKKLNEWQVKGLISSSQAETILSYESDRKGGRNWVIWGFMLVGLSSVTIGLVSIIAANWSQISSAAKLATYLVLQLGLAIACYRQLEREGLARELLIAFYALFFLAGIGLTAQIFNLVSNGYQGLLFWSAITLPVVFEAQKRFICYLWVIAVLLAHLLWFWSTAIGIESASIFGAAVFLSILSLYLWVSLGSARLKISAGLAEALRVLPFLIIIIGGSILGTIIWYSDAGQIIALAKDREWAVLKALIAAPWFGSVLMAIPLFFITPRIEKRLAWSLQIFFLALAFFVTFPFVVSLGKHPAIGALISVGVWGLSGTAAALAGYKTLFDMVTFAIITRLLVAYFEVFGSLMATGIGLVVSGLMVLGVTWLWYKFRGPLAKWVRQL